MRYEGDCEFCREPVIGGQAAFRVTGWEYTRLGGGANAIHGRERVPGKVAHQQCVEMALRHARLGIDDEQTALL